MKILIIVLMSLYLSAVDIDKLIGNFDTSYKEKSMMKKPKSTTFNKKMMMPSESQDSSDMGKMGNMDKMKNMENMDKMHKMENMDKMENKANNDIKMQKQLISKEEILEASFRQTKEYIESFYIIILASSGVFLFFMLIYIMLASMKKVMLESQIQEIQEIMGQEGNKDRHMATKHDKLMEEVRQLKLNLSSMKTSITQQNKNVRTSQPLNDNELKKEPNKENNDFAFDDFDNHFNDNDMDEKLNLNERKAPTKNQATVGNLADMDLDIAIEPKKTKKQKTKIEDMEEFNIDDFN